MKQKKQLAVLIVLLLIAGGVWLLTFRKGHQTTVGNSGPGKQDDPAFAVENPEIRFDLIDKARKAEYKSSGRNIFIKASSPTQTARHHTETVTPVALPNRCGIIGQGPCPPPPPEPPKLPPNLKYYGYGVVPNGTARRAFLHDTNGDEVHVVSEGEILLNRYRVLKIGNTSLQFEDITTGLPGTAPLEEQQPGGP